jgi:hypothetical protein
VDKIDVYDKEIEDGYDYYDDAASFNFGEDTMLKAQFLALAKGDEVLETAAKHNKKQLVDLKPAGKHIRTMLDV